MVGAGLFKDVDFSDSTSPGSTFTRNNRNGKNDSRYDKIYNSKSTNGERSTVRWSLETGQSSIDKQQDAQSNNAKKMTNTETPSKPKNSNLDDSKATPSGVGLKALTGTPNLAAAAASEQRLLSLTEVCYYVLALY